VLRDHDSRLHCHDTVLRYAVTLRVCTHPYGTSVRPVRECVRAQGGATQQVCKRSLLLRSVGTVDASVSGVTFVRPCNLYLAFVMSVRVRNCGLVGFDTAW